MSASSMIANAVRQRSPALRSSLLSTRSSGASSRNAVGNYHFAAAIQHHCKATASIRSFSVLATATPATITTSSNSAALHSFERHYQHSWFSTTASEAEEDSDDSGEEARLFSSLANLHTRTLESLQRQGITEMTEIQAKTWDAVSTGRDVIGRSRTGSGKTLAFLLPALERVIKDIEEGGSKAGIRILVISPTRELASQIDKTAADLAKVHGRSIGHQVLYGGVSKGKDFQQFERQLPTVLTATPGRLLDHLQNGYLRSTRTEFSETVKQIDVLVLDEMDRLLDMGFSKDIRQILQFLPGKNERQTLLFSATVPPSVKAEIRHCTNSNSLTVDCIQDEDPASHTVNTVQQSHVALPQSKQVSGVIETILHLMHGSSSSDSGEGANSTPKVIVFFNTTAQVSYYANILRGLGLPRVLELHSKISQESRSKTSDKFRNAPSQHPAILMTSDVSARGVDYPNVTHVLQVGAATDRETYIHRLGRTGRAGKSGKGILVLVHPDEAPVLQKDLKGMEVPVNKELQALLWDDDSGTSGRTEKAALMMQNLPRVLQSESMARKAEDCYRSLLGFYFQRFKALGMHHRRVGDQVVNMINEFSEQALLKERPVLSEKVTSQFGLSQHPDITVRRGGGGGGNRGGMGGGFGGRGRDSYGGGRGRDNYGGGRGQSRGRSSDRYDSGDSFGGRSRSSDRGRDRNDSFFGRSRRDY